MWLYNRRCDYPGKYQLGKNLFCNNAEEKGRLDEGEALSFVYSTATGRAIDCQKSLLEGGRRESVQRRKAVLAEVSPVRGLSWLPLRLRWTLAGMDGTSVHCQCHSSVLPAKGMGWQCCTLYKILLLPTKGFLLHHGYALAEVTAVLKSYSADEHSFIRMIK